MTNETQQSAQIIDLNEYRERVKKGSNIAKNNNVSAIIIYYPVYFLYKE